MIDKYIIAWMDLYAEKKFKGTTQRRVSISILTEDEAGGFFHNIVFIVLFNYMHRNSILHAVNNSDAGLITSWLLG
jgi:hypothetical protein